MEMQCGPLGSRRRATQDLPHRVRLCFPSDVELRHSLLFLPSQEQHPVGLPRTTGPMQSSVPPGSGGLVSGAGPTGSGFLGSQPPAAIMKQMLIDQRAQLMEQQKQQFLREQRQQQQQQQILAEQVTLARGMNQSFSTDLLGTWLWVSQFMCFIKKFTIQHFPEITEKPAEFQSFGPSMQGLGISVPRLGLNLGPSSERAKP